MSDNKRTESPWDDLLMGFIQSAISHIDRAPIRDVSPVTDIKFLNGSNEMDKEMSDYQMDLNINQIVYLQAKVTAEYKFMGSNSYTLELESGGVSDFDRSQIYTRKDMTERLKQPVLPSVGEFWSYSDTGTKAKVVYVNSVSVAYEFTTGIMGTEDLDAFLLEWKAESPHE